MLVMAPAVPESPVEFAAVGGVKTIRFGVLKLARSSRLKISARNCRRSPSRREVSFMHGEIPRREARADESVSAQIAAESAGRRRRDERVGIEPLRRFAENHGAGEIRIQKRAHGIPRVSGVRRVIAELRGEGKSILQGDDAVHRPAAHHTVGPAFRCRSRKALPFPKGNS